MKFILLPFALLLFNNGFTQTTAPGVIAGNVIDENKRSLEGATIKLSLLNDSIRYQLTSTDKFGRFIFNDIQFGYYKISISHSGLQSLIIDSLHLRSDRYDFHINDLTLKVANSENLSEVIIYSEKPLIESKDGNVTFNAAESALSAGSNASELLTNVPLVTKDPNGKLLVKGKEPKILIDDKPVELNQQQLQDLLESMPGSSIEKIEVLTNPPPQYANEQGGVINIVTRKGRVGVSGRIGIHAGTRGDAGVNGNFNYRKQGLSININAGAGYNTFNGEGYSIRENIYRDSSNLFKTANNSHNKNIRPNFRGSIDYDISKKHSLNLTLNYNQNNFDNENLTEYRNINSSNFLYRLSERLIQSEGLNHNANLNFTYTLKTNRPGESFRIITSKNFTRSNNDRNFYQEFFHPDYTPTGMDSTHHQLTSNKMNGSGIRLSYDVPLNNKKTSISAGSYYNINHSDIVVDASYKSKLEEKFLPLDALSNDFLFHQYISNFRVGAKHKVASDLSFSGGVTLENTSIRFELNKTNSDTANSYWSILPYANINKKWNEVFSTTASYRRTIRRPGLSELNPTIDESDPYNVRFGNPGLLPSLAHNIDLVFSRTKKSLFTNVSIGYNLVEDVFSTIRTRIADAKTQTTWQNISHRKEYEVSTWSGFTLNKKTKINLSASYTYNEYGNFDRANRRYRNGGSLTSNLNAHYNLKDLYSTTGSFTFNRFANPQGSVKSNISMNVGFQAKLLQKKLTASINFIDPFAQQQNRTFTYAPNFSLESFYTTQTRNVRLSLSYNLSSTSVAKKANAVKQNKDQNTKSPKKQN